MKNKNNRKISIVGAGLAGSVMSILLAKRGFDVEVYEWRPDMRKVNISAGKSINLALSNRGLRALRMVGMDEFIMKEVVPMEGRLVHNLDGTKSLQKYSGRQGNYINSVSRGGLNKALMTKAETYPNVKFHFNNSLESVDYHSKTMTILDMETKNTKQIPFEVLIGADGGGSAVRRSFQMGGVNRFSFSQQFLRHGFKELEIPADKNGAFRIESGALHIWPRHDYMMIALPNFDGSFTVTLFNTFEGDYGFDNIKTNEQVLEFISKNFPDAIEHMPNLAEIYFANPTGALATVKCFPWSRGGDATLIGDAAHAVVPFYGQGMNASFEDCRVLDEIIGESYNENSKLNWEKIFSEYQKERKENADAIGDLAVDNYIEMRSHTANPVFQIKRALELLLEEKYEDFNSKYSMVTFRDDIGYAEAKSRGEKQDELLMSICETVSSIDEIDLGDVYWKLKNDISHRDI
jgi:kynurenine 3-monooxygenase